MELARNITNVVRYPDGAHCCDIELFDPWTQTWTACKYVARDGDPAPVNQWILGELATGLYEITDWVASEEPEE